MIYPRFRSAACMARTNTANYIVVAGAYSKKFGKTAEKYDIAIDTWTRLPDMCERHEDHEMCALAGTVYVFLGA